MCSIGGFISSQPLPADITRGLLRALLFYGEQRGSHSAGVFVNNQLIKRAVPAKEFINLDEVKAAINVEATMALIHTRFPTSGGQEDIDAHPFRFGDTTVVHNGHISNPELLRNKFALPKQTEVDSEVLAAGLHTLGPMRFLDMISEAQGSAAMAAIHEGALLLARDGNPLEYFRLTTDLGAEEPCHVFAFASTESQLMNALRFCWLLPAFDRPITLMTNQLFSVDPKAGVGTTLGRFSTRSYSGWTTLSNGYHGSRVYEGGNDTTTRWMQQDRARRDLALVVVKSHFTLTEENAIKADPTILPPSPTMGYGWRQVQQRTHLFGVQDNRVAWEYDREYSEKQQLKFPNFRTGGVAKADKKGKKDRNRNQTSAANQSPLAAAGVDDITNPFDCG